MGLQLEQGWICQHRPWSPTGMRFFDLERNRSPRHLGCGHSPNLVLADNTMMRLIGTCKAFPDEQPTNLILPSASHAG
jgi:hypothetical protein